MIHVCIVDDDSNAREILNNYLISFANNNSIELDIKTFKNGQIYLDSKLDPDILFLDVDLQSDLNGIKLAKKIREQGYSSLIVFITNFAQYAIAGYEVEASDYIVKPVIQEVFNQKVDRLLKKLKKQNKKQIIVKSSRSRIPLDIDDIYYLEIFGHKVFYYTKKGKIQSRDSLNELETTLSKYDIVRCASCYMVNLKYVKEIRTNEIIVEIGNKEFTSVDLTRGFKSHFLNKVAGYIK